MHRAGPIGWQIAAGVVAVTAVVMCTQLAGWDGVTMLVPVAQVFTPYLGVATTAITAVALVRRRLTLTAAAAATSAAVLALSAPVVFPGAQPAPAADATGLRVAAVNLLYGNTRIDEVADVLLAVDADVLTLAEYTPAHQAVLRASPVAARYPYHVDQPRYGASGIALWSRYPIIENPPPNTSISAIDVDVDGPDGLVRVVALHLQSPVSTAAGWRGDLRVVQRLGRTVTGPTVVVGDLNATYWHPGFRRILDAGFTDAHTALDEATSMSWPAGWWPIPPFVRIDHALTAGGLVATAIDDIAVVGSDHRGVVVTVVPAR